MAILTKLKAGKALGAQRGFVETFNAIVDFVRNLKGDADVNNATGLIELDRSDAAHPVIRVKPGGKTGEGSSTVVQAGGCYTLLNSAAEGETPLYSFGNCYYKVGGVLYAGPTAVDEDYSGEFVALRVSATNPASATIETYSSYGAMSADSHDVGYVLCPLYSFDEYGAVACDFRTIPTAQMAEVL